MFMLMLIDGPKNDMDRSGLLIDDQTALICNINIWGGGSTVKYMVRCTIIRSDICYKEILLSY